MKLKSNLPHVINKYIVISNFTVLNKLFLVGDEVYFSESFHVMDGKFAYAHKVFTSEKKYLGMIDSTVFPTNQVEII